MVSAWKTPRNGSWGGLDALTSVRKGRGVSPMGDKEEYSTGKFRSRRLCREGCLMTEKEAMGGDTPGKMTDLVAGKQEQRVNREGMKILPCMTGANSAPSGEVSPRISGRPEAEVQEKVGEMLGGLTFRAGAIHLGGWLYQHLSSSCMTESIGNIFPLPSAFCSLKELFPNNKDDDLRILQNIIWSLNHLNGSPVSVAGVGTPCQQRLLKNLIEDACSAGRWTEKAEILDWGEFFRVKGVDYQGEEVKFLGRCYPLHCPWKLGRSPFRTCVMQGANIMLRTSRAIFSRLRTRCS